MKRKSKIILAASSTTLVLFFLLCAFAVSKSIERLESTPVAYEKNIIALKHGDNASKVVDSFVINPVEKFIDHLWLKYHKEYTSIQKGDYLVDGKKSVLDILKDMVAGNVVEKIYPTFSVVEGTNYAKIMRKISKYKGKIQDKKFHSLTKDKKKFLQEVFKHDPELLEFLGKDVDSLEGLVNPATYPMYEDTPLFKMFKKGIITQVKFLKEQWNLRDKSNNVKTPYEALILASLIERETFLDSERDMVAAVFENRMNKQMRLQTDPTVMYGVNPIFTGKLTKAHLKTDSPYNTYTRIGLPPTPICMPREKSIIAALHPADTKALYFVAKGVSPKDGHNFSQTLKEHNKAVTEYRQKVREYYASLKEDNAEDDDLILAEAEAQKSANESESSTDIANINKDDTVISKNAEKSKSSKFATVKEKSQTLVASEKNKSK